MKEIKTVAIYARVSTDKQSTDMQLEELKAYAKLRNLTISDIYHEQISGTKETRPEMTRLMADANMRKFDAILVWKLDRFGRSLKHLVTSLAELDSLGIVFVSLKDNIDFSTATGRFQAQILGAVAEFEASMIRERVSAGVRRAILNGAKVGPKRKIDRERVLELTLEGLSPGKIASVMGTSRSGIRKILKKF